MGYFDTTFQEFESKALRLEELLTVQIAKHSQFQESLHSDLRIAQSLLNEVTTSAANLATTLEDSLQRVNKFTSIGGWLTSPSWRTWILLVFSILTILTPKLVAACLLILGKIGLRLMGISLTYHIVTTMSVLPNGIAAIFQDIGLQTPPLKLETFARFASFIFGFALGAVLVVSLVKKGYIQFFAIRLLIARLFGRPERKTLDLA